MVVHTQVCGNIYRKKVKSVLDSQNGCSQHCARQQWNASIKSNLVDNSYHKSVGTDQVQKSFWSVFLVHMKLLIYTISSGSRHNINKVTFTASDLTPVRKSHSLRVIWSLAGHGRGFLLTFTYSALLHISAIIVTSQSTLLTFGRSSDVSPRKSEHVGISDSSFHQFPFLCVPPSLL